MTEIDLREMLEAGVHFGHKKDKWNPKMRPFIFVERNGVYIFDLSKTKEKLEEARKFAAKIASDGGVIAFIGTKNQVQSVVKEAAEKAEMPYMIERWPGGMLTNFSTILGRLKYLKDAEEKSQAAGSLTKKESLNLSRELAKLNMVFEGVKDLRRLPDVLFVADVIKERIAVLEAKKMGIPVIGIVDTNANPDIEYPIPANDDAVRSVKYVADIIAEAILESRTKTKERQEASLKEDSESAAGENDETNTDDDEITSDDKLEKLESKAEEAVVVKKSKPKEE